MRKAIAHTSFGWLITAAYGFRSAPRFALTSICCFAYMVDGLARSYVYLRSPSQLLTANLLVTSDATSTPSA
jgi:hypothetical protein